MNARTLCTIITSLALATLVIGDDEHPSEHPTSTPKPAAATAPETTPATPAEPEPTEAEMREAVQRHLNNLNAQMRPPPAPTIPGSSQPYVYSPYWRYYGPHYGYYYKHSPDSQYESWQDAAKRAAATVRVDITSFKKFKCTPEPDQQGFACEFVAELRMAGNNPAAQGIMQTSGQRQKAFFYKGDKGWICGEARAATKSSERLSE